MTGLLSTCALVLWHILRHTQAGPDTFYRSDSSLFHQYILCISQTMFWFWIIGREDIMRAPDSCTPHMGSDMGSAKFLPHYSILFLYLDGEVDLINELFLGHLLSKE